MAEHHDENIPEVVHESQPDRVRPTQWRKRACTILRWAGSAVEALDLTAQVWPF